jgi:uncharacterized damage-inducible protein DinB
MVMTQRPTPEEFAPYYATYIDLVPEGDLIETLERQLAETTALLAAVPEERSRFRYAEGKWTLAEVVGHINDTERIFAYRALRVGREDATPLASFDQDPYVVTSPAARMSLKELSEEFNAIRRASIVLLRNFDEAAWMRRGTASGKTVSARALGWMIAGHELHHRKILRERYL